MEQSLQLQVWIIEQLELHDSIKSDQPMHLEILNGDAGFRQYFRVNTQPSLLAVCAPVDSGKSESACYFAKISEVLRREGVPTPQIIACDEKQNFLLIEDFGDESFLSMLKEESADLLYSEASMVLLRMQQIQPEALKSVGLDLPYYNQALLREELELFSEWFVEKMLGKALIDSERTLLNDTFSFLEAQAQAQPQVLVHRDYHSRNIIYREGEAPGVIDFQDAVWGPITYDLVSLLRDCYVEWPQAQVKRWLITYGNLAIELGLMDAIDEEKWQRWFDTMGLQRHIKVLGVFARLSIRDHKSGYLNDLALTWRYVISVAKQYPQMQPFVLWCESDLLPLVEKQQWYRAADPSNATSNEVINGVPNGEPA
jgi:aminoglycoside/choline kinase family phosphotransferase